MITQNELLEIAEYSSEHKTLVWKKTRKSTMLGQPIGCIRKTDGYRSTNLKGNMYLLHRLTWLYFYGEFPKGFIDHIDGNKLNNSIENLRCVDGEESNRNMPKPKDNTSGVVGVSVCSCTGKWLARINHNKKTINLGRYDDFEEAVKVRKQAELDYGYHANHGRVA